MMVVPVGEPAGALFSHHPSLEMLSGTCRTPWLAAILSTGAATFTVVSVSVAGRPHAEVGDVRGEARVGLMAETVVSARRGRETEVIPGGSVCVLLALGAAGDTAGAEGIAVGNDPASVAAGTLLARMITAVRISATPTQTANIQGTGRECCARSRVGIIVARCGERS